MSKANDIAAAVATRLQGIAVASGFATDAGLYVHRGKLGLDADHLPAITVIEPEDNIETQRIDDRTAWDGPIDTNVLLPIIIEATGPCDADDPNVAGHALVADIKRAVFRGDLTWGGRATHTRYIGRTIAPRQDGTSLVTVTVQIHIGCVEDLATP